MLVSNPSFREAEEGGLPEFLDQSRLHRMPQASQDCLTRPCLKKSWGGDMKVSLIIPCAPPPPPFAGSIGKFTHL